MNFIRVESVQSIGPEIRDVRIFCVIEVTWEEYDRFIRERNERAERDRQNEIDWERERQWYRQDSFEG